jgi:hypothetical protein
MPKCLLGMKMSPASISALSLDGKGWFDAHMKPVPKKPELSQSRTAAELRDFARSKYATRVQTLVLLRTGPIRAPRIASSGPDPKYLV